MSGVRGWLLPSGEGGSGLDVRGSGLATYVCTSPSSRYVAPIQARPPGYPHDISRRGDLKKGVRGVTNNLQNPPKYAKMAWTTLDFDGTKPFWRQKMDEITEIRDLRVVREYTKADKDHAFEVYKDFSQGNRSLRKTSVILGVPVQTLSHWNKQFDWQRLLFEEDGRNAELMRRSAEGKLV